MTRTSTTYRCRECGWQGPKWVGRCPHCQAWGAVEQVTAPATPARGGHSPGPGGPARPIAQIDARAARTEPSGVGELDRVLGGGLVPGAVVLLAGEPGVGKSTLVLDVAARVAESGSTVLYVTGEESPSQVRLRAERVGALAERLYLAAETDLEAIGRHVEAVAPSLLLVDSVQTMASTEVDGAAGGVTQVREVTAGLTRLAKQRSITTVLVGHVTKDGSIAGPRALEHLVDVVLHFEGERHSRLRTVRGVKNRYGPSDEVGCFDLGDGGIVGLPDPSGLFLTRAAREVPGQCVTVTVSGRRPLVAEIQALTTTCPGGSPRRTTSGLDSARVSMILAVLEKRARLRLFDHDIYTATVGGMQVRDPAADLAAAMAVAGANCGRPCPPDMVAIGEVGLAGELRPVPGLGHRLGEAARLGFTTAIVPAGADGIRPDGLRVIEVPDLVGALEAARLPGTLRSVPV